MRPLSKRMLILSSHEGKANALYGAFCQFDVKIDFSPNEPTFRANLSGNQTYDVIIYDKSMDPKASIKLVGYSAAMADTAAIMVTDAFIDPAILKPVAPKARIIPIKQTCEDPIAFVKEVASKMGLKYTAFYDPKFAAYVLQAAQSLEEYKQLDIEFEKPKQKTRDHIEKRFVATMAILRGESHRGSISGSFDQGFIEATKNKGRNVLSESQYLKICEKITMDMVAAAQKGLQNCEIPVKLEKSNTSLIRNKLFRYSGRFPILVFEGKSGDHGFNFEICIARHELFD